MHDVTMLKTIAVSTVLVTAALRTPASEPSLPRAACLDGRQAALKAGGFSGPLLCDSKRALFGLVGTIRGAKQSYLVYDYRYQYMPEGGSVLHGGQRVVILTTKGKYIGQYALTPSLPLDVVVSGTSIAISIGGESKGSIEFEGGPPSSAFVDGERVTLFK